MVYYFNSLIFVLRHFNALVSVHDKSISVILFILFAKVKRLARSQFSGRFPAAAHIFGDSSEEEPVRGGCSPPVKSSSHPPQITVLIIQYENMIVQDSWIIWIKRNYFRLGSHSPLSCWEGFCPIVHDGGAVIGDPMVIAFMTNLTFERLLGR